MAELKSPRPLHVVGAAIVRGDRCLVARRSARMPLPLKWEFPGGKVEAGERPERALEREIVEELGAPVQIGELLGRGEALQGARRIVLDVYAATPAADALPFHPKEHSELRWASARELASLDWAPADIPVLPSVRARLQADPEAQCAAGELAIVCADWAKTPGKRAVCSALRDGEGWQIAREDPPNTGWSLASLVQRATALRDALRVPVLVGIDASLGLPELYLRATGQANFVGALSWLAERGGLQEEWKERAPGTPRAWRPDRPFFRVPPGRGGLTRYADAAGGASMLLRQIERRLRAKPTFVLSGIPGSVGSGTRELWKELTPMLRTPQSALRLWPFDGSLRELTSEPNVVLAEAYPRAAYALALAQEPIAASRTLAKTQARVREEAVAELLQAGWLRAARADIAGATAHAARANEDDFDALMGAVALVRQVAAGHALAGPLVDHSAEGGVLGTSHA